MIIAFEGIEGSGKQTQTNILKGFKIFKYPSKHFPLLKKYLNKEIELNKKSLFFLFLSDILNEQEKIVLQDSILDRYVFSTIAYGTVFTFEERKKIIEIAKPIAPDLVVYLDISPEEGAKRKFKQHGFLDRYEEDIEFLNQVRENYIKLYEQRFLTDNWIKIDATKAIEEISREIHEAIASL